MYIYHYYYYYYVVVVVVVVVFYQFFCMCLVLQTPVADHVTRTLTKLATKLKKNKNKKTKTKQKKREIGERCMDALKKIKKINKKTALSRHANLPHLPLNPYSVCLASKLQIIHPEID